MTVVVRPERHGDEDAIDRVTRAAFAAHPHSVQTEHVIVDRLRRTGRMAVSLVAVEEDAIVGHVAFSPVRIGLAGLGWYGLAPLSVMPGRQGRGIGTDLVRAGLDLLRAGGAAGCVVLGEPALYGRFGFVANPALSLQGVPADLFLSLAFGQDRPEGEVYFDDAFAVD